MQMRQPMLTTAPQLQTKAQPQLTKAQPHLTKAQPQAKKAQQRRLPTGRLRRRRLIPPSTGAEFLRRAADTTGARPVHGSGNSMNNSRGAAGWSVACSACRAASIADLIQPR